MSEKKSKRIPPKRLPVTVLHTGTVCLAVYKDIVARVVRDEQGDCASCPFKRVCQRNEKDIDTFVPPCSAFGQDFCRFVRMVDQEGGAK